VYRLSFDVGGAEAPAGYQMAMPPDTFSYPPVELDGIELRVASPLALYSRPRRARARADDRTARLTQ
jgi:hypothetical protein